MSAPLDYILNKSMREGYYLRVPTMSRFTKGCIEIIKAMIVSILMTFVCDLAVHHLGHEVRLMIIFYTGGGILAIATIVNAILIWSGKK